MNIVHVIDYFQPKIGYQEFFLAKYQKVIGHKVTVVTSDRFYPFSDYDRVVGKILGVRIRNSGSFTESGIHVVRLPVLFEFSAGHQLWLNSLEKTLKALKPDVIHCHNLYSLTSLRCALLKRHMDTCLVYDTHAATYNTDFKRNFFSRVFHFGYNLFVKKEILKNASGIYAIGLEEQKFISKDFDLPENQIPLIPLGADTDLFNFSKGKRNEIRKKYNIGNNILLIFSGKIIPGKRLDILLNAQKGLKDTLLMIIGSGNAEYMLHLKEKFKNSGIIWLDFVANSNLPEYYSGADIGCWPGNPSNTMLEAMACGLPIVVPKWPESEYLEKSGGVSYFKKDNASELRRILSKLINDVNYRKTRGQNAAKYLKLNLSWKKIAANTVNYYKRTKALYV